MSPRHLVFLALTVATLAKLAFAALTHGTNDVDAFYNFGRFISEHGLAAIYREKVEFNHLPLTGWYCQLAASLPAFWFTIRLPAIVADIFTVLALLRIRDLTGRPPWWALTLFALSPVSLLVSGFHGNIDPVLVLFLVLAAEASLRDQATRCGMWLALAANVKIIALLAAPVFAFQWWRRRAFRPFAFSSITITLLGWAVPLILVPEEFVQHVLGYSSNWGSWGVTYWLRQSGSTSFQHVGFTNLTPVQNAVMLVLKLGIILAVLIVAWRRRSGDIWVSLALVWLIFLALAPGVGAQYLIWPAPFLLLATPRAYVVLTASSAIFLGIFYHVISHGAWYFGHSTAELVSRWAAWSNLPWLAVLTVLVLWKKFRSLAASAPD